ncbi:MAG: hypothetical protein NTX16_07000, partial [Actinobacteria bacterium]|nr:hypothetical protein [Actinomycetota bacterium]
EAEPMIPGKRGMILAWIGSSVLAQAAWADLRSDFAEPPLACRSRPLWFWNGPLSAAETALVAQLNEANPQLVLHRDRVTHIDYADFELLGDYREFCRRRHAPFWGDEAG